MKNLNRKVPALLAMALTVSAMPSIVLAGTPMVIVGAPGGAAAAGAASIPTMSGTLMVVLGVLLAVVAMRFLRQKGLQQKVMSLLVLGSGFVIGGLGVQETQATSISVSVESSACSGATVPINPSRGDGYDPSAEITNECSSASIEVISYEGYPCPPGELVHQGAGPGAIIAAGDSALLSYCPSEV